jgi:hypothetical protein
MTLSPQEFLRRFLQHVLPRGFPRIRYFGWLANRTRKKSAATLPFPAPPAAASNRGIVLEPAYYLAVPSLPRPHVHPRTAHRRPDPLRGNQICVFL